MTNEKIKFIQWKVCEGESPCICISNFKCPFLDKKGNCTLCNNNISDEVIIDECNKAFIKWIEEE